jgi:tetratricopeptide (TPR) repeat protein
LLLKARRLYPYRKQGQEMGKTTRSYILIACIVAFVAGYLTVVSGTSICYAEKIVGFSTEVALETVRLNFVIEGGFPKKVNIANLPKITVIFKELQAPDENVKKSLKSLPSVVKSIDIKEGKEGVLEILLADPKAKAEYLVLPTADTAKVPTYRLVIDVVSFAVAQKEPPVEKTLEETLASLEKQSITVKEKKEEIPPQAGLKEIPFEEIFLVEADKAYNREDYNRAISLYRRYIDRAKGEHINEAFYGLAISLYKLNEKNLSQAGTEVGEALQQALDKSPDNPRAPLVRCLLANVFFKTGMTKRAQQIIEELLKGSVPNDVAFCAWKTLGEIYLQKANYIEAVKASFEAMKIASSPKSIAEISFLIGKTLSKGGAYKPALAQLKRAIEFYPALYIDNPEFLKIFGETLFGMRDYQGALRAFLWYLNLSPQAPSDDMLWAYIAETLLQNRKEALAERLQNSIIANMPDTEGGYITLLRRAQLLEEKGKQEQALAIYEDLSTKSLPDALSLILYFRWASLLKNQKKFDEAIAKIEEATEKLSSRKETASMTDDLIELKRDVLREWLLDEYRNGHYQKTIEVYNKYRGDFLEDQTVTEAIAISLYQEKNCSKALELLDKLLVTGPKPPRDWLLAAAYCAYVLGELDKAEAIFKQIPNLDKEHALILGKILMLRKKFAEATPIFQNLIALYGYEKDLFLPAIECLTELKAWNNALKLISDVTTHVKELTPEEKFKLLKFQIYCLENMKRTQELIEKVTEAIDVAPSQNEKCQLIYKLYNLYVSRQQFDLSESALKQLSQCEDPFWKKVGEDGLRYIEFAKKIEGKSKASGTEQKP